MAKIEAAKRQIETLEAELDAMFEDGGTNRTGVVAINAAKSHAAELATENEQDSPSDSVPAQVFSRMKADPSRIFTPADFGDLAKTTSIQNVRSTLIRLHSAKKVVKVTRGKYRMPPTQISLPSVSSGAK